MANFNHVGDLDVGEYLKIYSTSGIYNNLSEASELWSFMKKMRVAMPEGRQVNYNLRTAYGQSAFQFLAPGAEGSFPGKHRTEMIEATAFFKDFGTTIDVPRHLLNKEGSELASYAKSALAEETDAKGIATARGLSRQLCGDGSGSLGVVSGVPTYAAGTITTNLSTLSADAGKSHIGNFEVGETLQILATDTTKRTVTGGTVSYYKIILVDEINDIVQIDAYTSADVRITVTNSTIVATDRLYPLTSNAAGDHPDVSGSITDYGAMSFVFPGLESLGADDGRVVNGITMSGVTAGTRLDAAGATIDRTHFQQILSTGKRRAGKNRYKWDKALMFDTTYDSMMESWETDRMIISQSDNKRGSSSLGYQHGKDIVEFDTDEFVSKKRIIMVPNGDVLQYRGTDVGVVDNGNGKYFTPNDSNGNHMRVVRSYLEGSGLLFCTHPAALLTIENFSS